MNWRDDREISIQRQELRRSEREIGERTTCQQCRDDGEREELEEVDNILFHLGARFGCDALNDGDGIQGKRVETVADKHGDGYVRQQGHQK